MKNFLFWTFALIFIFSSCIRNKPVTADKNYPVFADSTLGFLLADTIIYDVNLANRNPDDQWATQRLKGLNLELMVNTIYDLVYSAKAMAFNHTTGEKLTIKQVQELELTEGFKRSNIDMIQFKEVWYMNPDDPAITKKVISMVLGTQVYDSYGQYLANRAIMRVELGEN